MPPNPSYTDTRGPRMGPKRPRTPPSPLQLRLCVPIPTGTSSEPDVDDKPSDNAVSTTPNKPLLKLMTADLPLPSKVASASQRSSPAPQDSSPSSSSSSSSSSSDSYPPGLTPMYDSCPGELWTWVFEEYDNDNDKSMEGDCTAIDIGRNHSQRDTEDEKEQRSPLGPFAKVLEDILSSHSNGHHASPRSPSPSFIRTRTAGEGACRAPSPGEHCNLDANFCPNLGGDEMSSSEVPRRLYEYLTTLQCVRLLQEDSWEGESPVEWDESPILEQVQNNGAGGWGCLGGDAKFGNGAKFSPGTRLSNGAKLSPFPDPVIPNPESEIDGEAVPLQHHQQQKQQQDKAGQYLSLPEVENKSEAECTSLWAQPSNIETKTKTGVRLDTELRQSTELNPNTLPTQATEKSKSLREGGRKMNIGRKRHVKRTSDPALDSDSDSDSDSEVLWRGAMRSGK